MIRKEINIISGEEKIIQLTEQEINELNIKKLQAEQDRLTREQAEQAKIDAKASALAKLSALGLTEEEVQAIIK